jgi:hypothetical protein
MRSSEVTGMPTYIKRVRSQRDIICKVLPGRFIVEGVNFPCSSPEIPVEFAEETRKI